MLTLDHRFLGSAILEPDRVPDLFAQGTLQHKTALILMNSVIEQPVSLTSISSLTRLATLIAATRLG